MTEPPRPSRSPLRWVLFGCAGCGGLVLLGLGGCGVFLYILYRGSDAAAQAGEAYLRNAPAVEQAVGPLQAVDRDWTGWNVKIVNDGGSAYLTYRVRGARAAGRAEVWLTRSGGAWTADGACLSPDGTGPPVFIGSVPGRGGP